MEKPALNTYPIHPLIQERWSPRAFADRSVEPWKVCSMLEAARWAPSCFNEQPWRFFVGVQGMTPRAHEILQEILFPGNNWAKKAPVLMLSVAKRNFTLTDEPNRTYQHDLGLAVENLVIQAEALGLTTHQMAGIDLDKALQTLMIPEGYEPVTLIAVGYPGSPETLDAALRERELAERTRLPLQQIAFSDAWGSPYPACFT